MKGLGLDYQRAEASGDFERLPAGGYVCRITSATDYPKGYKTSTKPFLEIVYDIAEGEYTGFYNDDWGKTNIWAHSVRWYYTPDAFGMFKGNLKALDESNGTNFETAAEEGFDERKMAGLLIGMIIGEEEYEGNDGTTKSRMRARSTRPVSVIREGRFKMPEPKRLKTEEPVIPSKPDSYNEDDLPF